MWWSSLSRWLLYWSTNTLMLFWATAIREEWAHYRKIKKWWHNRNLSTYGKKVEEQPTLSVPEIILLSPLTTNTFSVQNKSFSNNVQRCLTCGYMTSRSRFWLLNSQQIKTVQCCKWTVCFQWKASIYIWFWCTHGRLTWPYSHHRWLEKLKWLFVWKSTMTTLMIIPFISQI